MNILVLGGTVFLGRHIVEQALALGHRVTLLNRGIQNPMLYPHLETIIADRNGDCTALKGRSFDAVIDTSAYVPGHVQRILDQIGGSISQYVLISSISVYKVFPPGLSFDERAMRREGSEDYGGAKARCEDVLLRWNADKATIVRPGLIVGPHDPTGRFTYWPRRVAKGGTVLAPGSPDRPIQFVDVRDLARWCVMLVRSRTTGIFNATGPEFPLLFGAFLEVCRKTIGSLAHFVWLSDERLLEAGVSPWTELPMWVPASDDAIGGIMQADNRLAIANGLIMRPLTDTVRTTLEWDRSEGVAPGVQTKRVATLSSERESSLISDYT